MGNKAISLNPPTADEHLTTQASDWLWAAFSFITLSLLLVSGVTITRSRGTRLFHNIAIIVLATSSITYFSLASDLGSTPIDVEFRGHGSDPSRQIYYVRYIQWFINFPLLLLACLLTTGLPLSDVLTTLFMSIVVVITGLVGALVHSTYKWGYYTFGVSALFYIWFSLLWRAPSTTFADGGLVRRGYYLAAGYFSFMLITYPICWACAEGGNVITVDSEMIWYGILDCLTGPVFLAIFLWEVRNVDYNALGFRSGKYVDNGAAAREEKAPNPAGEQVA
ncbi:heat shock protein 30 [Laetiporus sulphureus 93-53]|uniref:Heat shock protein 30 n=1 Tax=Laetiporus sulphureus 93-53 TaxID=1314785 RepID=A0A165DQT6_9APHY|nr:heat shock protein 30 [Laetiporus sulphureus 93-53]KZT05427.1 heat shock protein 30 [Laetiporus sulphureus 93-53]